MWWITVSRKCWVKGWYSGCFTAFVTAYFRYACLNIMKSYMRSINWAISLTNWILQGSGDKHHCSRNVGPSYQTVFHCGWQSGDETKPGYTFVSTGILVYNIFFHVTTNFPVTQITFFWFILYHHTRLPSQMECPNMLLEFHNCFAAGPFSEAETSPKMLTL